MTESWPPPDHPGGLALVVASTPAPAGLTLSIRRTTAARLLMVSSAPVDERARSLDLGADVCLAAAEEVVVLEAQVFALLRRDRGGEPAPQRIQLGAVTLATESRTVTVAGHEVSLSRREFDLLAHLMRNPSRAFRRHDLLGTVWGSRYVGESDTVDVHIAWLRQKLSAESGLRLTTLRGIGYRLDVLKPA